MNQAKMSNTLKFLALDMITKANSGHPGVAMGLSDMLVGLTKYIKINPKQPKWINRDRLVFSGGHASALIYSYLHLCGYSISIEDLKAFRTLDSKTPGHPEYNPTDGIEITTGPLGQGVANAVGFAMAERYAENILGDIINHKVYCFCGDGDLEEGISYEACSLAGLHKLNNLILIYDSNEITIEGAKNIAFDEHIKMRFEAQNWEVIEIDGHDFSKIDLAFSHTSDKPLLIIAKTTIAKGALELEGSHKSHGAPFSVDLVKKIKKANGFDENKEFFVSDDVRFAFGACMEYGDMQYKLWSVALEKSPKKDILAELMNPNIDDIVYPTFSEAIATRASNGMILNAISKSMKSFVGGSADLAPSNNTTLKHSGDFPNGANLHFGIREHSMGAITNAFAVYGLFVPFCATFFVFSDYMSAAVRIAAISGLKAFFIWTHDSIGVGEDGATHQPIEQLSHFRAMPNLLVFRPADANENIACWKIALQSNKPCAFVLSRQNLHLLDTKDDCSKGGYIVYDSPNPKITFLSSGSEVHLALEVAKKMQDVRVVSVPCYDLLVAQDSEYIDSLCCGVVIAIEASRGLEWYRFADIVVSMSDFGKSAKGDVLFSHFGFSVENIINIAKNAIN